MPFGKSVSALILLMCCSSLYAADVNVYEDAVYLYLDKLRAAGLIATPMANQRPFSRDFVARLAREARSHLRDEDGEYAFIVGELEREFRDALLESGVHFVPLDSVSVSYTASRQAESPLPDNGLGTVSGRVQPLLAYRNGDRFDTLSTVYASSVHRLRAAPYFALYVEPKFYGRSDDSDNASAGFYRAYGKFGFGNVEIQAGRDDIRWGPGEHGLFFSGNARALDMIKVSSPAPFRFPGFLRHAGRFRATAFVSRLGSEYDPSGATLSGYRLDYAPAEWLNVGFDHAVFLGGEGTVGPDIGAAIGSFIGFLSSSINDQASSNHLMGMDANISISRAMGMEIYGKLLLEDTQAEKVFMMKNDASWLGGVYFPRIDGVERLSLRGEFVYSGQFSYRHWLYNDGFALEHKSIGYDAGSDTGSGTLTARYQFNLDEYVELNLRYLRRSGDHYRMIFNSERNNIGIERDRDRPEETHALIRVSGKKKIGNGVFIHAEAGCDRIRNLDFVSGGSKNDFSLQVGFSYRP